MTLNLTPTLKDIKEKPVEYWESHVGKSIGLTNKWDWMVRYWIYDETRDWAKVVTRTGMVDSQEEAWEAVKKAVKESNEPQLPVDQQVLPLAGL